MRLTFTILLLICCFALQGQDINQVKRSDTQFSFPVGKKEVIIGTDTTYMQQYANLEIKNDSFCLVGDTCLFRIDGLGVESYSIEYDTTTKGFDIVFNVDGQTTNQFIPFDVQEDSLVTTFIPTVFFYDNVHSPWQTPSQVLKGFRIDNFIEVDSIDEQTRRIKIGHYADMFGLSPVYHDSLDIEIGASSGFDSTYIYQALADSMALVIDRDTLNEGVLSFTETTPGVVWRLESNSGGATPFFNNNGNFFSDLEWDIVGNSIAVGGSIDYSDLTNQPSIPSQIWTDVSGSRIYYLNDVGIGTSGTPGSELDVLGRLTIRDALGNTFMGNNSGNTSLTGSGNLAIGSGALNAVTDGRDNLTIGTNAGDGVTTGDDNVLIGTSTMRLGNGEDNVFIGREAGEDTNNNGNVGVGYRALWQNSTGDRNIGIGESVMRNKTAGQGNVAIGYAAGYNNLTGLKNVFLGYTAGQNEAGSNKLYIENTSSSSPLIWGDFLTNDVRINGEFNVTENADIDLDLNVDGSLVVDGTITVSDNLEGTAVNMAAYDSSNKLTRVSTGSGIDLTSGTLSVDWNDAPADIQSLASAYMNDVDYDAADYNSYKNVAVNVERHDSGDISVNTSFEQFEIDADGGGYYNVFVFGSASCMTGETDNIIEFSTKVGATYEHIGSVTVKDEDNQTFTIQSTIYFSNNDDVILTIKSPSAAAAGVDFTGLKWEMIKI